MVKSYTLALALIGRLPMTDIRSDLDKSAVDVSPQVDKDRTLFSDVCQQEGVRLHARYPEYQAEVLGSMVWALALSKFNR